MVRDPSHTFIRASAERPEGVQFRFMSGVRDTLVRAPPQLAASLVVSSDKLEFKLIDGHIVCEGAVVDPPMGRNRFAKALVAPT
jgi:hypothetical protein